MQLLRAYHKFVHIIMNNVNTMVKYNTLTTSSVHISSSCTVLTLLALYRTVERGVCTCYHVLMGLKQLYSNFCCPDILNRIFPDILHIVTCYRNCIFLVMSMLVLQNRSKHNIYGKIATKMWRPCVLRKIALNK